MTKITASFENQTVYVGLDIHRSAVGMLPFF